MRMSVAIENERVIMKQNDNKGGLAVSAEFLLERDFYARADALWAEFEKQLSGSLDANDGMTPLMYAFGRDAYQFLSGSAERLFSHGLLQGLIERLEQWGREALDAGHVSTPHARVYINGCRRELIRDSVHAPWHYMLSLSTHRSPKTGRIRLLADNPEEPGRTMSLERVLNLQMKFNELLVHNTAQAYAVEIVKGSMNPLEGAIFLDGYLW
jgi:hypothetical protein